MFQCPHYVFFFLTGREFNHAFYSVSETEEEEEAALRQPMQLEKEALIDSLLAQKKYVSLFMCRRWQIIILTDALGDLMCDVFQRGVDASSEGGRITNQNGPSRFGKTLSRVCLLC